MLLFHKSNKKIDARTQINIKEVRDGVLILPQNKYRIIIETSSINFELKSEQEQDVLVESFQNFLNSLPCPLQILVRVRELDIDSYTEDIIKRGEREKEPIYKKQIKNYAEFLQTIVKGNKILTRRFYIIIPYETKENLDFALIKEQIFINQDIVTKGLEKMGMKARKLSSMEILDLFYNFYTPQKAKIQPLSEKTMGVLFNTYEQAYF